METIHYYNRKTKQSGKRVELTKGEQYQLMKENIKMMNETTHVDTTIMSGSVDEQGIDWKQIFKDTVSFSDKYIDMPYDGDVYYVDQYPTEYADLAFD